jgi:hypothetical protein
MWHPVYRRGYSIEALRIRLAEARPPRGTWAALQAIARLAHAGAEAGDLHVTPFNGRLFAPARAPLLDHLALDDGLVARALDALCFTRGPLDGGRQRIAYAELGATYPRIGLTRWPADNDVKGLLRRAQSEFERECGRLGSWRDHNQLGRIRRHLEG